MEEFKLTVYIGEHKIEVKGIWNEQEDLINEVYYL